MIQKKLRNYSKLLRDTLLDFCSQYHLPLLCTAILAMFMFHVASTASNIQRALSHWGLSIHELACLNGSLEKIMWGFDLEPRLTRSQDTWAGAEKAILEYVYVI